MARARAFINSELSFPSATETREGSTGVLARIRPLLAVVYVATLAYPAYVEYPASQVKELGRHTSCVTGDH